MRVVIISTKPNSLVQFLLDKLNVVGIIESENKNSHPEGIKKITTSLKALVGKFNYLKDYAKAKSLPYCLYNKDNRGKTK